MAILTVLWRLVRRLLPPVRVLRLSAYLTCVFVALSAISAGVLYAHLKETSVLFGRQLEGLGDLTGGAETIQLNGARLHYSRARTQRSVSDTLDRIEEHCKKNPGPLATIFDKAKAQNPQALDRKLPADNPLRRGVIRGETSADGMVLCFVSSETAGLGNFADAMRRFAHTSDLSEFGHVRYSYVTRINDKESRVVTMWTQSPLKLNKMFPGVGDAAGLDPSMLPRPPKSRRTLSAAVEGRPYAAFIYESQEPISNIRKFYAAWAKQRGWTSVERDGGVGYLTPKGNQLILALYRDDGHTYVTMTEAGRSGTSSIATVQATLEKVE